MKATHVLRVITGQLFLCLHYAKRCISKLLSKSRQTYGNVKPIQIICILRMRNESAVLLDTLNHLANIADSIIVYDDASTDASVSIAEQHSAVIQVIKGAKWKKNRIYEETSNRQRLLDAARAYNPIWIFYADCDERFEGGIRNFLLSSESKEVDAVRIRLFDAYMTTDDKDAYGGGNLFDFRKYFGIEARDILMIWRNNPEVYFAGLDAREPKVKGNTIRKFYCQHYGKAISPEQWESTCDYYTQNFPESYASKWRGRKGKAIHTESDFATKLYTWENVKGAAKVIN